MGGQISRLLLALKLGGSSGALRYARCLRNLEGVHAQKEAVFRLFVSARLFLTNRPLSFDNCEMIESEKPALSVSNDVAIIS